MSQDFRYSTDPRARRIGVIADVVRTRVENGEVIDPGALARELGQTIGGVEEVLTNLEVPFQKEVGHAPVIEQVRDDKAAYISQAEQWRSRAPAYKPDRYGTAASAIAYALRRAIQNGEIAPGSELPSPRMLVVAYKSAPPAVNSALQELEGEGLVWRKAVKGQNMKSFVCDSVPQLEEGVLPGLDGQTRRLCKDLAAGMLTIDEVNHKTIASKYGQEIPRPRDACCQLLHAIATDGMPTSAERKPPSGQWPGSSGPHGPPQYWPGAPGVKSVGRVPA